jgi:hypothetical protein
MSIGSFLASAGRIGTGIEQAQTDSELRRLQREQAASARAEMSRQEKLRQEQLAVTAPELPPQGLMLGAPAQVVEPEFAPAGRAGVELAAPEGLPTTTAGVKTDTAPVTAAKVKVFQRTARGVYVPMFDSRKPEILNTLGHSGFAAIDPNASDFERDRLTRKNDLRLEKTLSEIRVNTPFSGITKYFSPQDKKKATENAEKANTWYASKQANKYFRINPLMLDTARKDPVGFYNAVMGYSKAAPEGGRWRGQAVAAPKKAAAAQAGVAQAGVAPSGSKILANGFPKSYKDPAYDFVEQQAAAKVGVPVELLRAVRLAGEKTDADKVSSAGARTPYQFIPSTRAGMLKKYGVDAWSTPLNAATAAAYHLKESLDKGLSNEDALREYHGGPDRNKWGKVNDAYAARTMAFLGGAPASGTTAGVQLASSAAETPAPVRLDPSKFYLANQDAVPRDMQIALQNRQELARMAGMYQRAGMGAEFTQMRLKVMELDNSLTFLQGMQGIQELAMARDPRRLAAVWSQYTGVPVQLQPQTDGTYNVMVNNTMVQRGVSPDTIISSARSSFDAEYRNAQAASSSAMAMKQFESGLKIGEQAAKTLGDLTSALEQEKLKGATARDLEQLKNDLKIELERQNPEAKVTMTGDDTGSAILSYKDGRVATFTPGGEIEINGQTVKTAPTVQAVARGVGN